MSQPEARQIKQQDFQTLVENVGQALGLLALAALSSSVSQLTISPVYGAIPASINRRPALPGTLLLGFYFFAAQRGTRPGNVLVWQPLIAALVPLTEYLALLLSDQLGIAQGPVIAGVVNYSSIIIPYAYATAEVLAAFAPGNTSRSLPALLLWASITLVPFMLLETFFQLQLPEVISYSTLVTPVDIQLVVSAAYVLLCAPGPILVVLTWILLIGTYLINPHGSGPYADRLLNSSLATHDWTLLARQWSITGYVSVLESKQDHYRVLRCDHSLLGGEWLLNEERRAQGWTSNEATYSVFSMLEAVRLMETSTVIADADAKALVIGLGVGTAPKALLQHGIDTTVVELDPAVHQYATQYFDLPTNHTAVLRDAVSWLQNQAHLDEFEKPQYDYIIHDVFTGGAEPLPLFTDTFLQNLRALLKPDAVAAINYAGDLSMALTVKVLNTIDLAFDRQCDVYSDEAAPREESVELFSNFIVFCRNSPGKISFREPKTSDFLGSLSKRSYLLPKQDQRIQKSWLGRDAADDVLRVKDLGKWRGAQEESAKKHWRIMRTVLPARIWELY